MIDIYSHEAQLISEYIKMGNSLEETTEIVNEYLEQLGNLAINDVTESAIQSCIE